MRPVTLPDPYWLCRCQGWRVRSSEGTVGKVVRPLYGSQLNYPDGLLVVRGRLRKRTLSIPTGQVVSLSVGERTITVREAAPCRRESDRSPLAEATALRG